MRTRSWTNQPLLFEERAQRVLTRLPDKLRCGQPTMIHKTLDGAFHKAEEMEGAVRSAEARCRRARSVSLVLACRSRQELVDSLYAQLVLIASVYIYSVPLSRRGNDPASRLTMSRSGIQRRVLQGRSRIQQCDTETRPRSAGAR
jgi:hypothetical protein